VCVCVCVCVPFIQAFLAVNQIMPFNQTCLGQSQSSSPKVTKLYGYSMSLFRVADICCPDFMTRLSITILKLFVPVTASHQPYIVSNVSLKKKTEKFSPSLPTTSVLYTQIPWFHAGLTRSRSYKYFAQVHLV